MKSSTGTVALLLPSRKPTNDAWYVLVNDKRIELTEEAKQFLLGRGEAQGAVWWFPAGPAGRHSSRAADTVAALQVLADLGLQLAPEAALVAQQLDDRRSDPVKAGCIEVQQLLTSRRHAEFLSRWCGAAASPDEASDEAQGLGSDRSFIGRLNLWMASHGIAPETRLKVCADRRVAFSIRLRDGMGLLEDLRGALYALGAEGRDAVTALNTPAEQLMLSRYVASAPH